MKNKKREPYPFPRGRPIPPGKIHSSKKDYNRKFGKQNNFEENIEEKDF